MYKVSIVDLSDRKQIAPHSSDLNTNPLILIPFTWQWFKAYHAWSGFRSRVIGPLIAWSHLLCGGPSPCNNVVLIVNAKVKSWACDSRYSLQVMPWRGFFETRTNLLLRAHTILHLSRAHLGSSPHLADVREKIILMLNWLEQLLYVKSERSVPLCC